MKQLYIAFALVCCLIFSSAVTAQKKPKNDPNQKEWQQLFNGKDLNDWMPKIRGYELNDNFGNTFRVANGMMQVGYEKYDKFNERFGHIFYKEKFSYYIIAVEYRFFGPQANEGPNWATRNSGIMLHCLDPKTMGKNQDFPISIEAQLLGGLGKGPRNVESMHSGNQCRNGRQAVHSALHQLEIQNLRRRAMGARRGRSTRQRIHQTHH